ncbi:MULTISPECIES: NB-ARC domain-containing protein [Nostocales]|jgi:DNA-binding CsgD family transcriptional regulator|uniref:ATP-binding protein n=1 Tax=Dolichospermum flos-aquae UHCC 0037 TaxID=2590026 RepID=A0ACC7S5U5_DOLFA|nr:MULTISPECIES: NB-ARC domain-containing protein [Nostocales]ALB43063.1 ATPase domain-containing protein [Anabaena sp. WA102]MBO1065540.1 ATP-binding protein [Anabaena sp. 54]MTJ43867.1 ATP-binding protein [Dolichospermum flos-aquae UHCC 0037]OBQ22821.1 MAG: ATPase domain-containing protein [Anabaena sp. AL93]
MTVTEILQFVDNLVFTKTDKHLDDLQKKIIEELFQGKTYRQIANIYDYDEGYIGDESRNLFKILSESLGQNVNKSNFCWTIERVTKSRIINFEKNNINWCSNNQTSNHYQQNNNIEQSKSSYHDLTLSPKITRFYGRKKDLDYLSNGILNQHTHLISVLGLSGIGKTTLVKRSVDLNLQQFEVIIWRSLKFPKSLDLLIDDLLNVCQQEAKATIDDKLKQLFNIFKNKKCLVVLDDLENIFVNCQFAGQYKPEYQDYKTFLQMITEIEHQSCLILISQEKCQEMISLDSELYPIHCLELSGLNNAATEILKNQGLKNEETWLNLINLYESHPKYLQYISILIKDVFQSEVAEFIKENSLILTEDFKSLFDLIWMRLSEVEKEILLKISQNDQPISRDEIKQLLSLSSMDIINGLQSLTRRFLVSKLENDQKLYTLSAVFKEYLRIYHH